MPRATTSGTLTFGLVSVPVKFYTACSDESIGFKMITPKGNKIKQQIVDAVTGEVVTREECLKGYEHAKDQFVTFTADEVKALEADKTDLIDIIEFVPLASLNLTAVEKSYYLGPDKGGDKGYTLLSQALDTEDKVAVGKWAARGKEQLVFIRSYQGGLILHQMYYANEVRSFDEVRDTVAKLSLDKREQDLAKQLVAQLSSDEFDSGKYRDEFSTRVYEAAQKKLAGGEVTIQPAAKRATIVDMAEALAKSLDAAKAAKSDKKAATTPKKRKAS